MNFLFDQVSVHFEISRSIILDIDMRFLNAFWTTVWEKMDRKLKRSTTFYHKTDG